MVRDALESGEDVTILDVREPESKAAHELPDTDARIITHCAIGGRGTLAARTLREMGYTNVANMEGGLNAWQEKGYEIE